MASSTAPIRIRAASAADAPAVSALYRPYVERTAISFELDPPDDGEMARRMASTMVTHPWLVCEAPGRLLGYAYASAHHARAAYRWAADVSVYVRQDAQRQGVGRGLYTALFQVLLLQEFVNVYAGITLPNPGSVGLHEALGFQPVGVYEGVGFKFGAWLDVGWWQMALRPRPVDPVEPRRWPEVAESAACRRALEAGVAALGDASRRG